MQRSCDRLFVNAARAGRNVIDACKQVVKANEEWVAPYGAGATLLFAHY